MGNTCKCNRGYENCSCGCHAKIPRCIACCGHGAPCGGCKQCQVKTCKCPKCTRCRRVIPEVDLCQHALCVRCCGQCTIASLYTHYPLTFWAGSLSTKNALTPEDAYSILTKERSLDLRALKFNHSRRAASVEIEVAGINTTFGKKIVELRKILGTWQSNAVQDTSLPPGGFEINVAPACGDALISELTEIGAGLADLGARVNGRCGLHVHVDVRDFMYQDIQRLAKLYAACEWALFASCSHWRVHPENHFCTPCGQISEAFTAEKKDVKDAIVKTIYGEGTQEAQFTGLMRHGKRQFTEPAMIRYAVNRRGNINQNRNRYWALNMHSFFMRGTVECRMRQGSVDPTEMIMWARLWESLVDFAYATPYRELEELIAAIKPYKMPFAGSMHPAAARAGRALKPDTTPTIRMNLGSKEVFKGVGILAHFLPGDVFQWLHDQVVMFNTIAGDRP